MSWLARTIASTLAGGDDDDEEVEQQHPNSGRDPDVADATGQQPETPTRGVKGDISELTRRLWGVASFLAPPPQPHTPDPDEDEGARDEVEDEGEASPPRGIDRDLAEISAKVRSGISMLSNTKAVSEIGKLASSLFRGDDDEGEEVEGDERVGFTEDASVVGVTEEVLVFVRHIAMRPETWLDFPSLDDGEWHSDDFEMSDAQYEHAVAMESLVPLLSALREELCPAYMSDGCFWKIYFVLLHSKLNTNDAEILSTRQVLEARAKLQGAQPKSKSETESAAPSTNEEGLEVLVDAKVISTAVVQKEAILREDPQPQDSNTDTVPDVETEKHPVSTADVEVIDKAVVEEMPAKSDYRSIHPDTAGKNVELQEDEVEEWPEEEDAGEGAANSARYAVPTGDEEDVSFSDLEEEDDNNDRESGKWTR